MKPAIMKAARNRDEEKRRKEAREALTLTPAPLPHSEGNEAQIQENPKEVAIVPMVEGISQ